MKRYVKVTLSLFVVAVLSLATVYAFNGHNDNNDSNRNNREYPCGVCRETGICNGCKGRGTVRIHVPYKGTVTETCPNCKGSGKCHWCGGDGIKGN